MEYILTFVTGGVICMAGQLLLNLTKLTVPQILVIFVCAGVVLQGLNVYEPIVEFGKNGATVPLPGFGYQLAKGAMEGAETSLIAAVTGPVEKTAGGICIAITFGYIISLIFNSKSLK